MLQLKTDDLTFSFDPISCVGTLKDHKSGVTFVQNPGLGPAEAVLRDGVIQVKVGTLEGTYQIVDGELRFVCTSQGPLTEETAWPPAFVPEETDRNLYAFGSGVSLPARGAAELLPERLDLAAAHGSTMSFYGIQRDSCWLLCAVETPYDAALLLEQQDGLMRTQVVWKPSKGNWAYPRVLRFRPCESITQLCKSYRKIAMDRGLVITLEEKAKDRPRLQEFPGHANLWLWNDDTMDKLYTEDYPYSVTPEETIRKRLSIADEMRKLGMERVLWSLFDENTQRWEAEHVQKLGWLTTIYDIYTDVIPSEILHLIPETRRRRCEPRIACYPDGVVRDAEGKPMEAWALKCTDGVFRAQNRICEKAAIPHLQNYLDRRQPELGLDAWYLDVTYMNACECFDPRHPTDRTESVAEKARMMEILRSYGLIRGTEVGTEDAAACAEYNEGMLSPVHYRAYDAGRRMTHLYEGETIPASIPEIMLNPVYRVPLWQLVFHDCMVSYWYWGDSHNCCPELMPLRDLFCQLYGEPPLFSFAARDWERLREEVLRSYGATVPHATAVGGREMLSFDYVDGDPMVQRTVFAGGTTVTVDFRKRTSTIETE